MPNSTVNLVSTSSGPQNTQRHLHDLFHLLRSISARKFAYQGGFRTLFAACVLLIVTSPADLIAQTMRVRIAITSLGPARITITAEVPSAIKVLSFRNAYGGVLGLGERIEKFEASKTTGESVPVQKLAPGEFQTAESFTRFSYVVNVTEPAQPAQMSHVSWLNRNHGLLMLADLLPQLAKESVNFPATVIQLDVPPGWTSAANVKNEGAQYSTEDPEKTVFLIGSSLHEKSRHIGSTNFSIIASGKWPFSDDDAIRIVSKIMEKYSKATGFAMKRRIVLMLIPYPGEAGPERWTAETRDHDVVLLLGRRASRENALSKLGIVLSHELFHLWVPESLTLKGDYDWFFEGFTLYEALRMDLRLGLISFDDYLATLARVYDSYLASAERDRLSLLEASERRWTTSSSLVYDQGMLVAFIYDLLLRSRSDCKASLDDVYRQLFRRQSTGHGSANDTIIELLSEQKGMESFPEIHVEGADRINLESLLPPYGFQVQRAASGGKATRLAVEHDLSKPQLKLLGCLGYGK
ncbi:MAG: hypothetical protein M3Y84_00630 [Acidobacteriota bacterium]|nr:hypothetical protein [Acidobacteriota bacterium]